MSSQNKSLTTSAGQTYTGGNGNDVFNNTGALANFVTVAGSNGTDTLNLVATSGQTGEYAGALNSTATITSVENINVYSLGAIGFVGGASDAASAAFDVSAAAIGATALNIKASTGDSTIKAATTTDVTVANSAGVVNVNGGKAVTVTTVGAVNVGYNIVDAGSGPSSYTHTVTAATKAAGAVTVTTSGNNAVQVNGGTSVTTTSAGAVTIAAATGAVQVNNTGANNGTISVQGGTTVGYALTAANASSGTVTVGPTSLTVTAATSTTPDVLSAAYATGNVTVNNSYTASSGTVTYGSGAVAVYTNGATSVSITGGGAATVLDANTYARHLVNSADTAAAGTSLLTSVTLNRIGGSGSVTSDALTSETITNNAARAITNTVVGAHALTVTSSGNSSTTSVTDATATSFTVNTSGTAATSTDLLALSGAKASSVTINNTTGSYTLGGAGSIGSDSSVTAITVAANGSGTTVLGDLTNAKVTSVNASGATGTVSATVDATKATYAGGSGNDTLTIAAVPTKVISGGSGTDTLILNVAASSYATPTSLNNKISGFEVLGLGTSATGSYDGSGYSTLSVANTVTGAVTFANLDGNNTLNLSAAPSAGDVTLTYATTSGTSDAVTINVGTATGTGLDTTTNSRKVVTAGIENVTIHSLGTGASGTNTLVVAAAAGKSLVIDGAEALTLTSNTAGAAFATIDASAAAKAVNVSSVTAAAAGSAITGGAGLLTATGGAGIDVVTAGAGGVSITAGLSADTINLTASAAAADTVVIANGDSLYNSYDSITGFKDIAGANADKISFAGTALVLTDVSTATATNIAGVSYTSASGILTFAGPSLASATLANLIGEAAAIVNAAIDTTVAFVYGSDTYVVHAAHASADLTNASVVKLVGVTDATSVATTAAAKAILID